MVIRLLVFLFIIGCSPQAESQGRYSVVTILAEDPPTLDKPSNNGYSYGTGFYVRRNIILTAYHVLKGRDKRKDIIVVGYSNKAVKAKLIKIDKIRDLALLRIKGSGETPFKFCDNYEVGDSVYLLSRKDNEYTKRKGKIKFIFPRFVISSIPTQKGFSGAPVIKRRFLSKCVVGMHRLSNSKHVPTTVIKRFLKKALKR